MLTNWTIADLAEMHGCNARDTKSRLFRVQVDFLEVGRAGIL